MQKEKKRSERKREKKPERKRQNGRLFLCLLRGMAAAFAITCIFFIGFGILLTYTSLSEERLPLISLLTTALSTAAAGYDWSACMGRRGFFWGILAGGVYTVLLFFVTGLAGGGFVLSPSVLMTLAVAAAGGAIGGILGVNRNK